MISYRKARFFLWFIAIGLMVNGLVEMCGLEGSQEPSTGDEARAVSPSPTPVSVPALDELVCGVPQSERTVKRPANSTPTGTPGTTPHQLTQEPFASEPVTQGWSRAA